MTIHSAKVVNTHKFIFLTFMESFSSHTTKDHLSRVERELPLTFYFQNVCESGAGFVQLQLIFLSFTRFVHQ